MLAYMKYFSERGDEVTVITGKVAPDVEIPAGVRVQRIKMKYVPKFLRIWYFNLRLGKELSKSRFDFPLSMGRTYSQKFVIAPTTHRGYLKALNRGSRSVIDWLHTWLDHKTFRRTKFVFACSDVVRNEVIDLYGVDPEKVFTLYPPLDLSRFKPPTVEQKDLKERLGLDPSKKTFLFVSTSHKKKGLRLLLRIFEKLDPNLVELMVTGPQVKTNLPNVKSVGFIRDIGPWYHATDFTIHTSVYEPFGQIIAESLSCGTPVIVSQKTGAKEIVGPNEGIVVQGYDVDEWVAAVKTALKREFNIDADFAENRKLTIDHHVKRMLEIAGLSSAVLESADS